MRRVKIEAVPGTSIAEDKEIAAALRDEVILPSLADGEKVEIDFKAVDTATQSFVHALIADAIRQQGDAAFDHLVFRNCSPGVQQIVKTVFGYTMLATETAEFEPIGGTDEDDLLEEDGSEEVVGDSGLSGDTD